MKLTIQEKKENQLFNRTEIIAEITHENEPTPSREDIKENLSAKLNVEKELIVIKKLNSQFSPQTKCEALVYKNREDLEKTEHQYILKRGVPKEKAKPEETKEEKKPVGEKTE